MYKLIWENTLESCMSCASFYSITANILALNNLKPICARCNLSMSDNYTIKEWNNLNRSKFKKWWGKYIVHDDVDCEM